MKLFHLTTAGLVSILVFLPMILTAQRAQENVVALKNWSPPLYWHPNHAEREAGAKPVPQLQFSTNAVSTDALTFVAITPCRLIDTRGAAAGFNGETPFNGPSIPGGGTATFPVLNLGEAAADTEPAPCGVISSIAQAYSFNLTVIPQGGGEVGYVTLWPAGGTKPFVATLNDEQGLIVNNAAIVPAGTPDGGVSVFNSGPATIDIVIDMNGFFAAPSDAIGNTAIGYETLYLNTTGDNNTASGQFALLDNTTGSSNTASGENALGENVSGSENTAIGITALGDNTTGGGNTAIGAVALKSNTTGSGNIAIGTEAGFSAPAGNSDSIYIGSEGSASDAAGTIRIGTQGMQAGGTYIAGISGATASSGAEVYVTSNGLLGTVLSSGRFKEQITDMGDTSSKLFQLRPVNFFYKPEYDDGTHLLQYGLIAEEVAKVYPEMVAYGNDGQILTVKYQLLAPMLLNEVQKLRSALDRRNLEAEKQNQRAQQQDQAMQQLQARLAALETLLGQLPTTATATAGQ
jgi:hypothetical protein